ncbi:MAG TPA: hypothetical protein VH305_04190 [Gaiella sp.]
MAKTQAAKMTDTFETIRPYLERALRDEEFRKDLKDALSAARELYGPLTKGNGVTAGARTLATDKKAQQHLRRAVDDLASAATNLQGSKKKGHKGRKMLILAGIVAGALYNPWTGPQTREKLLDMIAGNDDLEPLESYVAPDVAPVNGEPAVEPIAEETAEAVSTKGSKASKS